MSSFISRPRRPLQMRRMLQTGRRPRSFAFGLLLVGVFALSTPVDSSAQYFGRNKVQYDSFDFQLFQTDHFEIYLYEEEEEAVA